MTRYALLSDIHANLEALEVVLEDIEKRDIDEIIVLGNTVGSGPDPKECWQKISETAEVILLGSHELSIVLENEKLASVNAREICAWSKKKLKALDSWCAFTQDITTQNYESYSKEIYNGKTFVHASPANPNKQKIWPGHENFYIAYNGQLDTRLQNFIAEFTTNHGFFGYTNIPTIMTHYKNSAIFDIEGTWNKNLTFVGPKTIFFVPLGDVHIDNIANHHVFINPGSVGFPRDGDRRASYAIYDETSVTFIRLDYDWETTQQKIQKLPIDSELKEYFVNGLEKGK